MNETLNVRKSSKVLKSIRSIEKKFICEKEFHWKLRSKHISCWFLRRYFVGIKLLRKKYCDIVYVWEKVNIKFQILCKQFMIDCHPFLMFIVAQQKKDKPNRVKSQAISLSLGHPSRSYKKKDEKIFAELEIWHGKVPNRSISAVQHWNPNYECLLNCKSICLFDKMLP